MKKNSLNLILKVKPRVKTQGSALLVSIVLSALMLTVGIMSARLAVRELELSADLFLSERAYFSAESGVEKSLMKLKTEPLAHVVPDDTNTNALEDANTEVSVRNLINTTAGDFPQNEFSFTLEGLQTQRFRFARDSDNDITTTRVALTGPISITPDNVTQDYFWRILCDNSGTTEALQNRATGPITDLMTTSGNLDDGTPTTFTAWTGPDKTSCFITIQNLAASTPNTFTFAGTTMAPHAATIRSMGTHQGRTKIIEFDYAQSTLGSLFDFSFLHNEDGL